MTQTFLPIPRAGLHALLATALAASLPVTAQAKGKSAAPRQDFVASLKACREIADPAERLACYDIKTIDIVSAAEAGDVRIIDREDLRQTRRQLFGFTLPDVGLLKDDGQDMGSGELMETSIVSGRRLGSRNWRFATVEGAVWEISNAPARLAPIKGGEKVEFKKAALGYFFIRINGQLGVKGRRVL